MSIITLLTDFGTADSYVAEMKGALLRHADITLVDISHQISPGDVQAGQDLLSRPGRSLPDGAGDFAGVDPGAGTEARAIGAESRGHRFVPPDNRLCSIP